MWKHIYANRVQSKELWVSIQKPQLLSMDLKRLFLSAEEYNSTRDAAHAFHVESRELQPKMDSNAPGHFVH